MVIITGVRIGAAGLSDAAIREKIRVPNGDGVGYLCVDDINKQCIRCIKTIVDRVEWKVCGNWIQTYQSG